VIYRPSRNNPIHQPLHHLLIGLGLVPEGGFQRVELFGCGHSNPV
jgi:hypothetical protein